jgi:hypothetical protein
LFVAQLVLQRYGRVVADLPSAAAIRICSHPCFRSDVPMTRLETRIAALQDLGHRLCAALSLDQLEDIRQSIQDDDKASDGESLLMRTEFLRLLDDAIERARQAPGAAAVDSVHSA